jgi:hypothetical protein
VWWHIFVIPALPAVRRLRQKDQEIQPGLHRRHSQNKTKLPNKTKQNKPYNSIINTIQPKAECGEKKQKNDLIFKVAKDRTDILQRQYRNGQKIRP